MAGLAQQQVALAFPRNAHREAFILGVFRFALEHQRPWSFTIAPEALSLSVLDLTDWPGQGAIATLNTPAEAEHAARLHFPVVNISSALADSPVPRSMVDNLAIGRLAAEHYLSRGFRSFGFYGLHEVEYARQRGQGFRERLAEAGLTPSEHLASPTFTFEGRRWVEQHAALSAWLASLDGPCGVFVCSDGRARHALDVCHQAGIDTPEQVAILGVDNDLVICSGTSPRLSSVARNDQLEGYRAAEMLDRLMQGQPLPSREEVVPPMEVVPRDSTAAFAVTDARLRQAIEYMLQHLADPITVEELAEHVDVSRRWIEYAFRDVLHSTPYQYLQRQRLMRAKQLLLGESTTRIYNIAQRVGFPSVKQFTVTFQREYGVTPSEFRKFAR